MKRDCHPHIIHGCLFMYLILNFFTQEYNWYRNVALLTFMVGYTALAVVYHLEKNGKL